MSGDGVQQRLFQQQEENTTLMLQVQEQRQVLDTLRTILAVNQNNYIVPAVSILQKALKAKEVEATELRRQVVQKSQTQTKAMSDLQKSIQDKEPKKKQTAAEFNDELEKLNATKAINKMETLQNKIKKLKDQLKLQQDQNKQLLNQNNQLKNLLVEAVNNENDKKTDLTEEQLEQFLQMYKKAEQENQVLKSQISEITVSQQMTASRGGDMSASELDSTKRQINNQLLLQKDAIILELRDAKEKMEMNFNEIIALKNQRIRTLEELVAEQHKNQ